MSSTITVKGFIGAWEVNLTLDETATDATIAAMLAKIGMVETTGLTATPLGLKDGQEKETIATVVRREASDGTPIVDFYPAWSHGGEYGIHKFAHLYLNTPADVAQFEAQSGLKLADMPVLNGTALQRKYGKVNSVERTVFTPFDMVRTRDGEHESGMPKYEYAYFKLKVLGVAAWYLDDAKIEKLIDQARKDMVIMTYDGLPELLDVAGLTQRAQLALYPTGKAFYDHIKVVCDVMKGKVTEN